MNTQYDIFVYSQLDWAFGAINSGLSKHLYQDGYNFHLFDWQKTFVIEDLHNSLNYYDAILTCCDGSEVLLRSSDESLVERIKFVVPIHSYRDVFWIKARHSEYMQKHINYTALCPWIIDVVKEELPNVNVNFSPLGIDTSLYSKMQPPKELKTLGYAGARDDNGGVQAALDDKCPNGFPAAKKRSEMAWKVAENVGLHLECATADWDARNIYRHYTLMPGWYTNVDAICVTSLQEGAGLPALEAAAAGKLVISTDVGHFDWHSKNKGGIMLPTDREDYIREATKILKYFKEHPQAFAKACKGVQNHALENYSWNSVKDYWIKLLQ